MIEKETPYEPTLEKEWRRRIEEQFGHEVRCSADCERLAADIEARTGEHVGVTSVKRWFGFAADGTPNIRRSTREIMAQFLGYKGLREMQWELGDEFTSSWYAPNGELDVSKLAPGTLVRITWDPGRDVEMEYIGDCRFIITKSVKSKLQVDDRVRIMALRKGLPFQAVELFRGDFDLKGYNGAEMGGLTSLEIY